MVSPINKLKCCPCQVLTSAVDLHNPKTKIKFTDDHYLEHDVINNVKKESSFGSQILALFRRYGESTSLDIIANIIFYNLILLNSPFDRGTDHQVSLHILVRAIFGNTFNNSKSSTTKI